MGPKQGQRYSQRVAGYRYANQNLLLFLDEASSSMTKKRDEKKQARTEPKCASHKVSPFLGKEPTLNEESIGKLGINGGSEERSSLFFS
jgi:hypothetical protein